MAELSVFDRARAIQASCLTMPQKFLLTVLNQFAGNDGEAWPSHATLAAAMSATDRAIRKWQSELESIGVLTVQSGGGRGSSNLYRLNLSRLPQNPEPRSGFTDAEQTQNPEPRSAHPGTTFRKTRNHVPTNRKRKTKEKPRGVPLPENLMTDAFQSAWQQWVAHRREIRKTLTPTTTAKQLAKLSAWGPDKAIRAIHQSIEQGWQGLFDPDDRKGGTASGTDATAAEQAWQTLRQTLRSIDPTQPYKAKLRQTLGDRVFNAAETVGWSELFDLNQFTERKLFALFSAAIGKGA